MTEMDLKYMEKWVALNTKMQEKNMTWGTLEEEDDFHQYMSMNVIETPYDQWDEIRYATEEIGKVLNKTYQYIMQNKSMYFSRLGLPPETWDAVSVPSDYFSYFTRLDLIVNDEGIKLIEINCDTPTGYLETSVANEILCEEKTLVSPNQLPMNIFRTWRDIQKSYGIDTERVYFTSYGENEEDKQTVLFNMEYSGVNGRYIAVEDIKIDELGMYDADDTPIKFLYRLYPLEFLPTDVDENGREIGKMFLKHVADGTVKIINPPSAFLMQSKAMMAIIWELSSSPVFTEHETQIIHNYFLPTFFDEKRFESVNTPYVKKPVFGREGGGVHIYDGESKLVEKDEENWYNEWSKVYQKYVEMPDCTIDTWTGEYTGKLLVGSFLIGGRHSGVFLRVGEKITGNLSMFCGIAIK